MKPLEIVSVSLPWAETVTSVRTQSCYPQGKELVLSPNLTLDFRKLPKGKNEHLFWG